MKLATWNLALPIGPTKRKAARAWTDRIAADVWVLTETHDGFSPGLPYLCHSAAGRDGSDPPGHRWATIWSRDRLEELPTTDLKRTAAARVFPDQGDPFLVFGSVLPWLGSKWQGKPSAGGIDFEEALKVQADDWLQLRREYPNEELFVMGDFNQDLVHPRYYGSGRNREALTAALNKCGFVALTGGDGDPVRRDSPPCACIDHICGLRDSCWRPQPAVRWPDAIKPDTRLSDHFGVAVCFDRAECSGPGEPGCAQENQRLRIPHPT